MGNSESTPSTHRFYAGGDRALHKWKINGFSSLLKLGTCYSCSFNIRGYTWRLSINPKTIKSEDGKSYISLQLHLLDAHVLPSDVVAETVLKLRIYDQIHGRHKETGITGYFETRNKKWGCLYMIPHDEFNDPSFGFLIQDTCIVGVEIMEIEHTLKCPGVSECLTLKKEITPHVFTWKIENFFALKKARNTSEAFLAGNFKWHIELDPYGKNNCLSIFLVLDCSSTPPPPMSGVYVEFSLCVMDQIDGKHKKGTQRAHFNRIILTYGWDSFMSLEDFSNPSKGYLVNKACSVKAKVTIIGSVSWK